MSLLDGYDILDEGLELEESKYFIDNLDTNDTPALFQAWFDIFVEKFVELPNDQKITYLNILNQHFPKYRIGHNIYKVGTTCIFQSGISGYVRDALSGRIRGFVNDYVLTDKKDLYNTTYILHHTLLWVVENMDWAFNHKIYVNDYLLLSEVNHWGEPEPIPIKVETKYKEIRENIERLLDIKIKRGELE